MEGPRGLASPAKRHDGIVVFGFEQEYRDADLLHLPGGSVIRIPDIPGYLTLKMRSWTDRAPPGETKDAEDIATALWWWMQSGENQDELYTTSHGKDLLLDTDVDPDLATAHLLGREVRTRLLPDSAEDLRHRWQASDLHLLARRAQGRDPPGRPYDDENRRAELLRALAP